MSRHLHIIRKANLPEDQKEYLLDASRRLSKIFGDKLDWGFCRTLAGILENYTILWSDGYILNCREFELGISESCALAYTIHKGERVFNNIDEVKNAIRFEPADRNIRENERQILLGSIILAHKVEAVTINPGCLKYEPPIISP